MPPPQVQTYHIIDWRLKSLKTAFKVNSLLKNLNAMDLSLHLSLSLSLPPFIFSLLSLSLAHLITLSCIPPPIEHLRLS